MPITTISCKYVSWSIIALTRSIGSFRRSIGRVSVVWRNFLLSGTTLHGIIHRSHTSIRYICNNYITGCHMFKETFSRQTTINECNWIWNFSQLTSKNQLQNGFKRTLSRTNFQTANGSEPSSFFFATPQPRPPPQPNPLRTVPLGKAQRILFLGSWAGTAVEGGAHN